MDFESNSLYINLQLKDVRKFRKLEVSENRHFRTVFSRLMCEILLKNRFAGIRLRLEILLHVSTIILMHLFPFEKNRKRTLELIYNKISSRGSRWARTIETLKKDFENKNIWSPEEHLDLFIKEKILGGLTVFEKLNHKRADILFVSLSTALEHLGLDNLLGIENLVKHLAQTNNTYIDLDLT